MLSAITGGVRALGALALPQSCAGCGAVDQAVCRGCAADTEAARWEGGPRAVAPDPCPPRFPPTWAAARFEGALAGLLTAYKDEGRRDLRPALGALLAASVDAALGGHPPAAYALRHRNGPVLLVPVPSSRASRRRRGDVPLAGLAAAAVEGAARSELAVADALVLRRRVADQAGLSARDRARNLEHAMAARPGWTTPLKGASCVLVDDVLTTGATLLEASRALRRAGARSVCAATICATQRRRRP